MIGTDHPICLVAPDVDVPLRPGDSGWRIRTLASLDEVHAELKALAATTKALMHAHYTADGFNPKFEHVLVEASQLPIRHADFR